jgi:REP element-mobilizing transposase RayT
MMDSREFYRDESRRLKSWDYSTPGGYFVTICTKKHRALFGRIENGNVQLSSVGKVIAQEWEKTGDLRSNVMLDEYIIMPNHLHGIIFLQESVGTPRRGVHKTGTLKSDSLGSIIGQFKSACTRRIRASANKDFAWQASFFDHIIRSDIDLQRIRKYISENPAKWTLDKYYYVEK